MFREGEKQAYLLTSPHERGLERIVHIYNVMQCTNLGGMEQASLRLMQALQKRSHTFEVLSLTPLGGLQMPLRGARIPAEGHVYKGIGGWRSAVNLRSRLQQVNADALLMTGHNLLATIAMGDLCQKHRVLAIHSHHSGIKPNWQWKLIYRVADAKFTAITFPSDCVRLEAIGFHPSMAHKCHTIRNPICLPDKISGDERRMARKALGLSPTDFVVGNAGWLIPRKQFDVFLTVAAEVSRSVGHARFVIAGDGPDRGQLEFLAKKLNLSDKVLWLGWKDDLVPFYRSLDVLLFNSDWDAYPTTPMEALSYGIPVVASLLWGGLREVMTDRRIGFLLSDHDVSCLAEVVIRLACKDLKADHGGRARIAEIADPTAIAMKMENLLTN